MRTIFSILFLLAITIGCKEKTVEPTSTENSIKFIVEKDVYASDDLFLSRIINNTGSTIFLPYCNNYLYGINKMQNNSWIQVKSIEEYCITPFSNQLNTNDTAYFQPVPVSYIIQTAGTFKLFTYYKYSLNGGISDTIYSNTFVVK